MLVLSSYAQKRQVNNLTTFDDKRLHFGFTLGINSLDFHIENWPQVGLNPAGFSSEVIDGVTVNGDQQIRADVKKLIPGFTVGMVSNLRLSEYFDLRFLPGMSFGERRLVYNIPIDDANENEVLDFYSIKSTLIELPLLVKYKSQRLNNLRPYVVVGASYKHDISKTGKNDLVRLKPGSFYFEAGMGLDTYLQFFRLSTELKICIGMNNALGDPPIINPNSTSGSRQKLVYYTAISKLTSNIFILSFHFE